MLDWGLLSDEFPKVKKTVSRVKMVKTPTKKMKRTSRVTKKIPRSNPATKGGDIGISYRPSSLSSEVTKGSTKEDTKEKEDITAEEVESYLKKTFENVFREKLEREDRILCDPAELVIINKDVEPWHRGWAREVPAHYEEEGRALINDLLKVGVISQVTRPLAWCTQGFFVPKPGSQKLRLVTD